MKNIILAADMGQLVNWEYSMANSNNYTNGLLKQIRRPHG